MRNGKGFFHSAPMVPPPLLSQDSMDIKYKGKGIYLVQRTPESDAHEVDLKHFQCSNCKGFNRWGVCAHLKEVCARVGDQTVNYQA